MTGPCLATGRGCESQRIAALPVDRTMRRLIPCFAVAACLASITSAAATPAAFLEVDRAARAAFVRQRISGMGLSIYDARGNKVFEQMYGDFSPDRRIPIASASKLVAGLTILRLVDQGKLSLESTTGAVLGWKGPQGAITLRHLLSFTSGLPPRDACTLRPESTLAECASTLSKLKLVAPPGTRFDYGNTHLHVAARMAEVVTGKTWDAVFGEQLRVPLAIDADAKFYTWPRKPEGTTNPLIAGGMQMTINEYAKVLDLEYHRGLYRGQRLISDALFTAQATEHYPNAVIGDTPVERINLNYHYGLASWLMCPPPAVNCPVQSSPGAFGFTPWVDRTGGYYAILGMDLGGRRTGVVRFSVQFAEQLRPLIRTAMRH
jgi:D-alanyl-D-alanine-carboxypeptidase/D-alanyl-D-alanine-endopeptidase